MTSRAFSDSLKKTTNSGVLALKTCLVVPCYNEETRLETQEFLNFVASNPHVDLLFVNDGSKDGTLGTLKAMSAKHPQAKYLDLPQNGGKAEAVRQGMLHAHQTGNYDFIGYWDADLSTPLDEVRRMHRYFDDFPYLEMIFGSRLLKLGNEIRRNWFRHYAGRIFATCVSNMVGVKVYDTQCGSKLFRASVIPDICDEVYVSRWFFDVEILWRFMIKGHSLQNTFEMPHKTWIHRDGSKLKFKDFALTFWELFRIRQHYRPLDKRLKSGR